MAVVSVPPPCFFYLMAKKKEISQPTAQEQRMLDNILNNSESYVTVRGKKWTVRWVTYGQLRKVSSILLEENQTEGKKPSEEDYAEDSKAYADAMREYEREALKYADAEDKVICKCAAALRLDGFLKSKLHGLLWRWYYYVKSYTAEELLPYITECKKKVPAETYYASIMLLTGMKDTMMAMTREEVDHFQVAQLMEQRGQSARTTKA